MYKQVFGVLLTALLLTGCGKKMSDKYEGTWSDGETVYSIQNKGDHYDLNFQTAAFGKKSYEATEDSDGYLVYGGERKLEWHDANSLHFVKSGRELHRVK